MVTYGKKKRSVLNSFYTLRDFESTPKSNQDKVKRQGTNTVESPRSVYSQGKTSPIVHQHNSIEDLASILLDDTSNDDLVEKTIGSTTINSRAHSSYSQPYPLKEVSRESDLSDFIPNEFEGRKKTKLLITRDSSSTENFAECSSLSESGISIRPRGSRKSPKRMHRKKKSFLMPSNGQIPDLERSTKLHRTLFKNNSSSPTINLQDLESKCSNQSKISAIQTTVTASKNLKYYDKFLFRDADSSTGKQSTTESGLLTKLKSALHSRKQSSHFRKIDSRRDAGFLDSDMDELTSYKDKPLHAPVENYISSTEETEMIEDENIKTSKKHSLKNHKTFKKNVRVDSGLFPKNRKSVHDQIATRSTSFNEKNHEILSLISDSNMAIKESFDADGFTAHFSSSPLAQSTPRSLSIALFDEDENINYSTDSVPLFQTDKKFKIMKISDHDPMNDFSTALMTNKRKGAQEERLKIGSQKQKKIKKHPSPSKMELDKLQQAMQKISSTDHKLIPDKCSNSTRTEKILAPKDKNTKIDRQKQPQRLQTITKLTSSLYVKPGNSRKLRDMSPKGEIKAHSKEYMMDIDELQLENSTSNVGIRWK
ncbi:hypothetical protein K3495_g5694 [Podosphaera aphanis]|nr:hypothetical protein K3495_g5694 [Podosphaera aphanis]